MRNQKAMTKSHLTNVTPDNSFGAVTDGEKFTNAGKTYTILVGPVWKHQGLLGYFFGLS